MIPCACWRASEALWVQVVMRDFAPEEDEAAFGLSDMDDVRYRFSGPGEGTSQQEQPPGRAT
jgi:hypothetical protein